MEIFIGKNYNIVSSRQHRHVECRIQVGQYRPIGCSLHNLRVSPALVEPGMELVRDKQRFR